MSKELPIADIEKELYEVLADKTLSFGCIVKHKGLPHTILCYEDPDTYLLFYTDHRLEHAEVWEFEIIGHEPTLNDVLLKLVEAGWNVDYGKHQIWGWCILTHNVELGRDENIKYKPHKSFDSQDETTKRKLHSLICVK